jgi:glycosyltransferase involved in cell wall biosynthesis
MSASSSARVCIVTFEIIGPFTNGGVATIMTGLAEALSAHDIDVTVLYTRGDSVDDTTMEYWVRHYASRGIKVVPLRRRDIPFVEGPASGPEMWERYGVYHWLKQQEFDVVHLNDSFSYGFYCVAAKRLGVAFHNTDFWLGVHGPAAWVAEANKDFLSDVLFSAASFAEAVTFRFVDMLWSASRYIQNWLRSNGFGITEDSRLLTYILPSAGFAPNSNPASDIGSA